jgi:hypothetical protein
MYNHYHVVLHVDRDEANSWEDMHGHHCRDRIGR